MAINRREFFRMGGLSLGAISPLGLSLPQVLANEKASGGRKQINVIFMFLQGGASHLDMYDLKPDAPSEIRGKYNPARTNIPGLHLSDQLPKLGKCADKFSLIRSMQSFSSKPALTTEAQSMRTKVRMRKFIISMARLNLEIDP